MMRSTALWWVLVLACLMGWCPSHAGAVPVPIEDQIGTSDVVVRQSYGWRFSLAPALLISPRAEPLRMAFGADLRYGFVRPRVVIAPGVRLGAALLTGPRVYTSFATVRFTFVAGRFGPFVIGGLGGGYTDRPAAGVMGGCGVLVHFEHFAVGLEATFQNLINTPYQVATIGPQLLLAF